MKDGESFSRYICDLCHSASPISALRQCVICGRWACPDCWRDEYYVCSSCNGIIRLHLIETPGNEKKTDQGSREPERLVPGKEPEKKSDIPV